MSLIHMETEQTRQTGHQVGQLAVRLDQEIQTLRGGVQELMANWQGNSALIFEDEARALFDQLTQVAEVGTRLADRVQREVDEWEAAAQVLAGASLATAGVAAVVHDTTAPANSVLAQLGGGQMPDRLADVQMLHLRDHPSQTAIDQFVKNLKPGKRPVIFLAHGFRTQSSDAEQSYQAVEARIRKLYAGVPGDQQPVFVGVDWDAEDDNIHQHLEADLPWVGKQSTDQIPYGGDVNFFGKYESANNRAWETGQTFGTLLDTYHKEYPDSNINIIAHSLGNRMSMEALKKSHVTVDKFLSIEAAVGESQIAKGQDFQAMLDTTRVKQWDITYTPNDWALKGHNLANMERNIAPNPIGLGNGIDRIRQERPNFTTHSLEGMDSWFSTNHYGINIDHDDIYSMFRPQKFVDSIIDPINPNLG